MKIKLKNTHLAFLSDLALFSSLVILLVSIRSIFRSYFQELQNLGPSIYQFAEQLGTESAAQPSPLQIEATLDAVTVLLNKSLFLNYVILPLAVFVIFFVFQSISWKILTKSPVKRTMLYLIFPLLLLVLLIVNLLSQLAFSFLGEGSSNMLLLILNIVFLVIAMYFSFIALSNPKASLEKTFKLAKEKLQKILPHFILFLITHAILLLLLTLLYIFLLIKVNIFTLVAISLLFVYLAHYQQGKLIKKAKA